MSAELCFASARELVELLRTKRLSARELMTASLSRIEETNPTINAIVAKLDDDRCLELAAQADEQTARGEPSGPLHGLPIAFKDTAPALGFPWTQGSPIFKDFMPTEDSAVAARLRRAGAIAIGKTNVPEFGLGSHSYNNVYGTTVNAYDTTKSAGGSSGGAAAALASGMLPIADGSDLGGSLRNPANFNNIVALRPSSGVVPNAPTVMPFIGMAVKGPMARSVADTAFLLSVMAGHDPRDAGSLPIDPSTYARPLERDFSGTRVAWCPDLDGLPLDPRVREVLDAQRSTFEALGCIVEDACPDLGGANEIFCTLRAWMVASGLRPLYDRHRDQLKPEAVWQVEAGLGLAGADVHAAMTAQGELLNRVREFQQTYEFFVCAVNQVPPFDAAADWPKEIDGVQMENYIAWMKSAYYVTVTARPAISVPAGFTSDGLPVGVQIVGRYRDDFGVLQIAHAFEQATNVGRRRPSVESHA